MTNMRSVCLAGLAAALLLVGSVRADDSIHKAAHRGDLAQVRRS